MEAETATLVDEDGNEEEVPLEDVVEVGDRMKVRPGEDPDRRRGRRRSVGGRRIDGDG